LRENSTRSRHSYQCSQRSYVSETRATHIYKEGVRVFCQVGNYAYGQVSHDSIKSQEIHVVIVSLTIFTKSFNEWFDSIDLWPS
jgi:hypothetical protein